MPVPENLLKSLIPWRIYFDLLLIFFGQFIVNRFAIVIGIDDIIPDGMIGKIEMVFFHQIKEKFHPFKKRDDRNFFALIINGFLKVITEKV